ncbi:MAG: AAA family ATPase [Spongiibacteraceae bacterium]
MKVKKIAVTNVRSFLERQELLLDGEISIIIGPNGGGKTNLLDTVVISLRKSLFASEYPAQVSGGGGQEFQYEFRPNEQLNQMILEKHSSGQNLPQIVELEIEVTQPDLDNMRAMQRDAERLTQQASKRYRNLSLNKALSWNLELLPSGTRIMYEVRDNAISHNHSPQATLFLEYLRMYEMDKRVREDFSHDQLSLPVLYLPVTRAASGFQSSVGLSGYNEFETKRSLDATNSRSGGNYVQLAIGRLAKKYRLLLEEDKGRAQAEFAGDANMRQLTDILRELGYEWKLETVNPMTNEYSIRISKQGASFLVSAASSGERELLTYLFVIFGLNVRDALVVVDEPELHLHPKWQRTLLSIFVKLSEATGNQFLIATHSPTFISPQSIQYVSRVSSVAQKSQIRRLNSKTLPDAKYLLNIINSQNNERLFFADAVVLVEGISDRLVFQRILEIRSEGRAAKPVIEVVEIGGKGFFGTYQKLLDACQIPFSLIADRDYIEQIGSAKLKTLFKLNAKEIKEDVLDNIKSNDASTLVGAIESAIASGNWDSSREIWEYIKSRRRELRHDLNPEEQKMLNDFIDEIADRGIHLLRHGAIEAYLPIGCKGKDLERVIKLCADESFWDTLPVEHRDELATICDSIWNAHSSKIESPLPVDLEENSPAKAQLQ